MAKTYVVGHLNPDSDSICSAIAYARLKNRLGENNVIPTRAGKVNRETKFILDYFDVDNPQLIKDVKMRVCDIPGLKVKGVPPYINLRRVWERMQVQKAKTIPVVDDNDKFLGLVTLGDLARKYMSVLSGEDQKLNDVSLKNIMKTIDGKLEVGKEDKIINNGKVVVGAMMSTCIERYVEKGSIVIIGNRMVSQLEAIKAGASLIVVTGNYNVDSKVRALAEENDTAIMRVEHDSYAAARLITMSEPVSRVMKNNDLVIFYEDDMVEDIRPIMLETRYRNYPVVNENNKFIGLVARYHLLALNGKKIIMVDHNEKSQAVPGIEEAEILEVIDHHRLGDVQTGEPILFRNEPVGSTATIVASLYWENKLEPEPDVAGIMLGAILSDTMLFKSPTCTTFDKYIAEKLAEIVNVDIEAFGVEMFKAGTSLEGRTPNEILHSDFKGFKMGELNVGIGQVETMDLDGLEGIKNDLVKEMQDKQKDQGYDLVMLMLSDIYKDQTELLVVGERKEAVAQAFNTSLNDNSMLLKGVLSRKKQVVPPLSKFFSTK
ncbi:manganese-dependent inorganic pyrophosphatase [Desulfitispora alkaliphila]|uniref:putative manganese-dependent inorganic diphosphatase n=1 Tax=Desulfitispora alkaliphila TaxID=622674 RepID=UPI003D251116